MNKVLVFLSLTFLLTACSSVHKNAAPSRMPASAELDQMIETEE